MSARIDDLIQLMRLSGTDKVREYLERVDRMAHVFPEGACVPFLTELECMFKACKRSDISEAWPSLSGSPACAEAVHPETAVSGSGESPAGTDTPGEI